MPIRALLLTDVVDSTRLSEELGDAAMAELWARHDRVARDLLPPHAGREIDKTDGFLLLFERAANAVAYAVAYHRALRDLGITARAGLHVGDVILTENRPEDVALGAKPLEVDGIAKPTAARVMSVAGGGQLLLTPAAHQDLGDTPVRSTSHGHWRMKGVSEPIELFEVGDDDAPFTPPADGGKVYRVVERAGLWVPAREVPHSLPAERDGFVGRASDLVELARRLAAARMVSVLGIGGTGKTRLVTRYGWTWLGDYPGGVWFCDLVDARDLAGIVAAVARGLDVPLVRGDMVDQLAAAIRGRGECLVVLDNFEQVAQLAPDVLEPWLNKAPEARFLVTSREVLGIAGESVMSLAPLGSADGRTLFETRARSAGGQLNADDGGSIDALIELLDGLPLAIELAAARSRMMSPAKLLERMSQRFRLLAGKRRGRQGTLRAALDWSWELLSPDEQCALAELSVFEGGFDLDAAEAVLELDEAWPVDAVQALVDKSLVRPAGQDRFRLLVSVQEYAAEKLTPEARERAIRAHGLFYAAFEADDSLGTRGGVERAHRLALDLDNLVVACRRAAGRSDAAVAIGALEGAAEVWLRRGPHSTAIELSTQVLQMTLEPVQRGRALLVRGSHLYGLGRLDASRADLEAAVELFETAGEPRLESLALSRGGLTRARTGDRAAALKLYERALKRLPDGNERARGGLLTNTAVTLMTLSRLDDARAMLEQSLRIHRAVGSRDYEGTALSSLAKVSQRQGDYSLAERILREAIEVHQAEGYTRGLGAGYDDLGLLMQETGRHEQALEWQLRSRRILAELGERRRLALQHVNIGMSYRALGRLDEALTEVHQAIAIHRELGSGLALQVALANLADLQLEAGQLEASRAGFEQGWRAAVEAKDRHFEGWIRGRLGHVEGRLGLLQSAADHLDAAVSRLQEMHSLGYLAEALARRAEIHLLAGELDLAQERLAQAIDTAPAGNADAAPAIAEVKARLEQVNPSG